MQTETITLPNELFLAEVSRMLDEGSIVTLRVKGLSMNPFIVGDRDSVELVKAEPYVIGDIVLAHLSNGNYVLHRIFEVNGDNITLMGDGNLRGTEHCKRQDICGVAVKIIHPSGKEIPCRTPKSKRRARIWRRLMPVRRYLLFIYHRTIMKMI